MVSKLHCLQAMRSGRFTFAGPDATESRRIESSRSTVPMRKESSRSGPRRLAWMTTPMTAQATKRTRSRQR